ncbi:sulfurtransferase [Lysobacter sp. TY2-98]|uniref:sulfurtransferase n=1 Tax=Lysobacter sp. TY2-98 TaxID=2290922 RepID=UPI000E206B6A|nr:sulfurtransferase [Lysobacter sp. TY2-98]AXK72067.1 sulfurtransferase [Lysobacter sp. TY2-98]
MLLNVAAYHFTPLDDADALAATLRTAAEAGDVRGTILVAPEGVNLFLAGDETAIDAVLAVLHDDARFAGLDVKRSWSCAQPFGRLKVKRKPEIITFRRDGTTPFDRRAPAVDPPTLARWIAQGTDDDGRRLVLLDTRNREEFDYGTFGGAMTLPIDNFTDLPAALAPHRDELADATVVSFCTGGIRCEKAALWLHDDGMQNVLQLDGGILGYFEQVGGFGYDGHCFVFDGRVALDPQLKPVVDAAA